MFDSDLKSAMREASERHRPGRNGCPRIALGVACTVGLLAGPSANSDTAAAPADNDPLVEVTVSAQRHEESPQTVPISLTQITPGAALNGGAVSTDMLAQLVPGVQMGREIDSATTFIRGTSTNLATRPEL